MTVLGVDALHSFLAESFPQMAQDICVDSILPDGLVVRLIVSERHLRPGGTVSGPSLFALADVAVYLSILSRLGPIAMAVTTNCSIDFMRKPRADVDLRATAKMLKMGRSLAVGDVLIHGDKSEGPVARATLTYSIPPDR